MATLDGNLGLQGSFGNLSSYKMRGVDKLVVRTKGGASKAKIKKSPSFARTRENNSEFGGCGKMVKEIRHAIQPIKHLADFNFTANFTSLAKKIQLLDGTKPRGQRGIHLSQFPYLFQGFSLNKKNAFDAIVKNALLPQLDRENGKVRIQVPALIPGINLSFFWQQPFYRLVFSIGMVSDMLFGEMGFACNQNNFTFTNSVISNWLPVLQVQPAQEIILQLNRFNGIGSDQSIFVAVGIEMGSPLSMDLINPVRYCGAGKILLVG
jgi:hypothetical protein